MQFIRTALVTTGLFLSGLLSAPLSAADLPYENISPPVATGLTDKVLVAELFLYSCPHCYHFDPVLEAWRKKLPAYVEFIRVPAQYNDARGIIMTKAYYTAEALGIADKIHSQLFAAFHEKKQRFTTENQLQDFFVAQGVSAEDFLGAYHSFAVDMRVRLARTLTSAYGIQSVPMMVVNGKYRLESGKAGGYPKMLIAVDELIEQERGIMGIAKPAATEAPAEVPAAAPAETAR